MRNKKVKLLLFFLGLVSQVGFYLLKKVDYYLYQAMLMEDSLIENLTSLNYCICSIMILCFYKPILGLFYRLVLAMFFLFIALEEISYGQRFFAYESNDFWNETNIQSETNLHNMPFIHEYLIPSAYCLITIIVLIFILNQRLTKKFKFPVFLAPYFIWIGVVLPVILITKHIKVKTFWFVEPIDVESSELILSFGFLFLIFFKMKPFYSKLN